MFGGGHRKEPGPRKHDPAMQATRPCIKAERVLDADRREGVQGARSKIRRPAQGGGWRGTGEKEFQQVVEGAGPFIKRVTLVWLNHHGKGKYTSLSEGEEICQAAKGGACGTSRKNTYERKVVRRALRGPGLKICLNTYRIKNVTEGGREMNADGNTIQKSPVISPVSGQDASFVQRGVGGRGGSRRGKNGATHEGGSGKRGGRAGGREHPGSKSNEEKTQPPKTQKQKPKNKIQRRT